MVRDEFADFYGRYHRRIKGYVRTLGADVDPDDATQLTLLRMWTIWDRIDHSKPLDGLAFKVARDAVCDMRRDQGKIERILPLYQDPRAGDATVERVVARDEHAAVREAIGALSDADRDMLLMRYWDDMPTEDIAALRGTTTAPPTTTTTRTSPRLTTMSPRRLAKPVEWIVGFHQWPGLQRGDTFLGETIINTQKGRFIVVESDDATFKKRAEQRRNVRYVERNKKLVINDFISLPHHDYGPGDTVPAGPRWPFPNAGITGGPDEGCVWLLDENDKRYNVLWPEGFRMRYGEPLTIYNENHEPVWKTGQRLDIDTQPSRSAEHWQRVHRTCRVSSKDNDQPDQPIALIMPGELP